MNDYVTGFSFGGKHDIESATGVFPFGENMCVSPCLGWCFPGGWQRDG